MRTITLLLSLLCVVRAARGENEVTVVVTGDAAADLSQAVEGWLSQSGRTVVPSPFATSATKEIADCVAAENDACARIVVEKHAGAVAVVVLRARTQKSKQVAVTGYWFEGGREAVAGQRVCDPCSGEALTSAAQELVSELARSHQRSVGRLRVTSSPSGAVVQLDGQTIGVTPLDYDVSPGNHHIALTADRHDVETRAIAIRVGETTKLDVPLDPTVVDPPRSSRVLPVSLLVGGGLVVATGAVLFAIDEDHVPSDPALIRDTAPYGVGMIAVGGAALAVGAWLLIRTPPSSPASSRPVAFATGDSAYVGWTGTF